MSVPQIPIIKIDPVKPQQLAVLILKRLFLVMNLLPLYIFADRIDDRFAHGKSPESSLPAKIGIMSSAGPP